MVRGLKATGDEPGKIPACLQSRGVLSLRVMFSDFMKALGILTDPESRRVMRQSFGLTLLTFLVLWIGATFALGAAGEYIYNWADAQGWTEFWLGLIRLLYATAAVSGVVFSSFLLFPAVIGLVLSFYLDPICDAVEGRHYPELPPARNQPLMEMTGDALRMTAIIVLVNLAALPLYLVLLFFPPFNALVFYGVNGYLLGREFFEIAAVRRLSSSEARRLRHRQQGRVFLAGVVIAILLTLPVINIVMPIVAIAFMLHVFERMRRDEGYSIR